METQLRIKKAVVFGGGSGIGLAIARQLLSEGATVVLAGRTLSKVEAARDEINDEHVHAVQWDVADVNSFSNKIKEIEALVGEPDGFVNAAGMGTGKLTGRGYEPWDLTPEEWDGLNNINFKGTFFLMRNEINYMRERGIKGNILNIASNAAYVDIEGSYGVAKGGIIAWTHTFGLKFGSDGIIINCIAPGATFTDMIKHYAHAIDQPYERHAIGRFISPSEIARLASFLMSDLGVIVCGHTVIADGGDKQAHM